jgi:NAD(P)H-dependent FMN reductase
MNAREPNLRQNLAVIYGSNREERLCDKVGAWALSRVADHGRFEADLIDPVAMALPDRMGGEANRTLRELRCRIEQADAFLVVTPEYNHGYPAVLKLLIDSAHDEWRRKPAAFVSYGGISGGLRAVEQLRQVFAELHVVGIRDGVSIINAWERFDKRGMLSEPLLENQALAHALDQLAWWSRALAAARAADRVAAAA